MRISKLVLTSWLLIVMSFLNIGQAQKTTIDLLEKFVAKRAQYQSISYTIILENKLFSEVDTMVNTANVEIVRNQNDLLFGGIFSITIDDSLWYGYDGEKIMQAKLDSAILTTADAYDFPYIWVKTTWVDNFLDYGFIKSNQGPKALIQDTAVRTTFCDTVIGGWPCLGIFFHLPDEGEFERQTLFMAIDTIEFMARSRMYSVYFQENEQYQNWLFENVKYSNHSAIEKLGNTFMLSFKSTEQYFGLDTSTTIETPELDYTMLQGKIRGKDEIFKLTDIKEKLIILDFWYTSCYPCIKAMPAVNKLYRDYKDRGVVVYGINMFDDEVKDKSRLDKFFRINEMTYEAIMINKDIAQEIVVEAYPTLLILDENYQVIFKEEGFSDNLYTQVSEFLDSRL